MPAALYWAKEIDSYHIVHMRRVREQVAWPQPSYIYSKLYCIYYNDCQHCYNAGNNYRFKYEHKRETVCSWIFMIFLEWFLWSYKWHDWSLNTYTVNVYYSLWQVSIFKIYSSGILETTQTSSQIKLSQILLAMCLCSYTMLLTMY